MCRRLAGFPHRFPIWALLFSLFFSPAAALADEARRVLILHTFGPHFAPFDTFSSEFRAELIRQSPEPLDIIEQSVDSTLLADAVGAGSLVSYLQALFEARPPDLIVTFGGTAAKFVQVNRDQLFPEVPTLITALADQIVQSLDLMPNEAALPIKLDLRTAVANILRLLPETRNIFVVLGNSPLERYWAEQLAKDTGSFSHIEFEISNNYSFDAALDRVATLPSGTAVLYGGINVDANGVPYGGNRAVERFSNASSAPVFGLFDSELGLGIVGGPLMPITAKAPHSAVAIALRLLEGEPPSGLRLPAIEPQTPTYDARELDRWGISEAMLPPGSVVQFREPTVWQLYRWPILLAVALLAIQGGSIGVLLVSRSRLKRARAMQWQSEQRLGLAAESAGIGLWERDFETAEIWASDGYRKLFGLPDGEPVTLEKLYRAMHPADQVRVQIEVERATAGNGAFDTECRPASNNPERWLAARGQVEFGPDGQPIRIRGVVLDITERRRAEQVAHDLSGRLIQAQEDERSRLARELHDDVTQRLAVLAIDAGRGELKSADATDRALLRGLRKGLVRLSEDVHALSYRLHPSILADLGLIDALRVECDRFARAEAIPVGVETCDLPQDLSADTALCLFRIAQEALRNVARHAGACEVSVGMWLEGRRLHLSVMDDGRGFAGGVQKPGPSLGLASMRQRVSLAGGDLQIDSVAGKGTIVRVSVPLDREETDEQTTRLAGR